jgi:hypothetical protein
MADDNELHNIIQSWAAEEEEAQASVTAAAAAAAAASSSSEQTSTLATAQRREQAALELLLPATSSVVHGFVTAPYLPPSIVKRGNATAAPLTKPTTMQNYPTTRSTTTTPRTSLSLLLSVTPATTKAGATSPSPLSAASQLISFPFPLDAATRQRLALDWLLVSTSFLSTLPTRQARAAVEEGMRLQAALNMREYEQLRAALKETEVQRRRKRAHLRQRRALPCYAATLDYRVDRLSDVDVAVFAAAALSLPPPPSAVDDCQAPFTAVAATVTSILDATSLEAYTCT